MNKFANKRPSAQRKRSARWIVMHWPKRLLNLASKVVQGRFAPIKVCIIHAFSRKHPTNLSSIKSNQLGWCVSHITLTAAPFPLKPLCLHGLLCRSLSLALACSKNGFLSLLSCSVWATGPKDDCVSWHMQWQLPISCILFLCSFLFRPRLLS